MAEANPGSASRSDLVRTLVRDGRIEAALGAVQHGTATEQQLSEELHIYQAELLLQNEQLRAAEQVAERALEQFRQLYRAHPEPVLLLDREGRIVECNDEAARLFGIGSLGGVTLFFSQRLAPSARAAFNRSLADAARGGVQVLTQLALHMPEGDTAASWDVRVSGVPGDGDTIPQCVVVLIDQSRMLLRQDELQRKIDDQARHLSEVHAQALAAATAHARVATRLIGELQQPLQRVVRYSRSLHDVAVGDAGYNSEFARSQLDAVIDAANSMLRIVADLGQVVQAESGVLQARPSAFEMGTAIREACRGEEWSLPHGIRFELRAPAAPTPLSADRVLVDQVLRILLRKAVSHAVEGSAVVVSWSAEPADSELPERVLVTFARRGARRTPNELSRMFSLFAAPAPARAEATKEHLAMMTCRVMVELHAGRIWAANAADGFEVRLWLPRTSDLESVRAGA